MAHAGMPMPAASAAVTPAPVAREGAAARRWTIVLRSLPIAALLVYAVSLGVHWRAYFAQITGNSDLVGLPVLSGSIGQHAGTIHVTDIAYFSSLFVDVLLRALPANRLLMEAWPYALFVLGIAVLGWSVHRVLGWWSASLAVAVCAALTPALLIPLAAQGDHGVTVVNTILLTALLVAVTSRDWARPARGTIVLAALVGVVSGADVASDRLLLVTGLVPFTLATLLLVRRWRDAHAAAVARCVAICLAVTAASAVATTLLAGALSITYQPPPISVSDPAQAINNIAIAGQTVRDAVGAGESYLAVNRTGAVELVVGVTLCVAVVMMVALSMRRLAARTGSTSTDVKRRGLVALTLVWSLVMLLTICAFVGSDAASHLMTFAPYDLFVVRYDMVLWPAAAVLLPAMLAHRPTALLVGATVTSVLVAVNAVAVASPTEPVSPGSDIAPVVASLEARHVHVAYASYWDANQVTWQTGGSLVVRPAFEGFSGVQQPPYCSRTDAGLICPILWMSADGWFAPTAGPVAVIVDPRLSVASPPSAVYGAPSSVLHIGRYTVYIFARDLGLSVAAGAG